MKTIPGSSFLLAAILTLGCFSPSLRADETKPPAATPVATDQVKQPIKLINVDFPGGSVAQLVAVMAKSDSATFNVIGEKPDLEVQLPPFSLRNVEPRALSEALRVLLLRHDLLLNPTGPDSGLYVLSKPNTRMPYSPGDPTRSMFESYQLTPYLPEQSVDDIVGAIRAGWELDPAHDRNALRVKFHPATSVLLVSGPGDAIMLTNNVLGHIKRTSEKNPAANPKNPPPPEAEKK